MGKNNENLVEVEFLGELMPNEVGRYAGRAKIGEVVIQYSLTPQSSKKDVAYRGTISILDPETGRCMVKKGGAKKVVEKRARERKEKMVSEGEISPTTGAIKVNLRLSKELRIKEKSPQGVKVALIKGMQSLYAAHQINLLHAIKSVSLVDQVEFFLLVRLYGDDFLAQKSQKPNMRQVYLQRLTRVGKLLPGKICDVDDKQRKKLKKDLGKNWEDYFSIASQFVAYLFTKKQHLNDANPFNEIEDLRVVSTRGMTGSVPPEILSDQEDILLNQIIRDNIADGSYMGLVLVKECGFSAQQACSIVWNDVKFNKTDPSIAFVYFRRDGLSSATHDYTAPISKIGAQILRERMNYLIENGDKHVKYQMPGWPVVSEAGDCKTALEPAILTALCRSAILHISGSTELLDVAKKGNSHREGAGIRILLQGYEYRLRNRCLLDEGAIGFMQHRALRSVQADHYRDFTDETARDNLTMALSRDTSGREIVRRDYDELVARKDDEDDENMELIMIFPSSDDEVVEAFVDAVLDVDEKMEISCDGGCSYDLRLK